MASKIIPPKVKKVAEKPEKNVKLKPKHGRVAAPSLVNGSKIAKIAIPETPVPPNPKLLDKLSFADCALTPEALEFPSYLEKCGILDMIIHAFARLEREKEPPQDPWEWLRYRFFLRMYNPGDKESFNKAMTELKPKKDKLIKERNDLLRAKTKREETTASLKV